MSENTSDPKPDVTPDSKPDTPVVASPEKSTKKPADARTRAQKWRRRIIVVLMTLLLVFVVVRALVPLLLPTIIHRVAGIYGLTAAYDKLDFNMMGGDVGLWNLRFTPKEGGEPILTIGYCRGSVATLALLKGQLYVERAEAEDATVVLERLPDGSIPLLERFLADRTAPQPEAGASRPTEIPLESPLTIRALRLQHAEARLIDRTVLPATDVRLLLNLILSDIGFEDAPTRFSVHVNSPELLGALYVDGQATARNRLVNADLAVRMIGLNLKPLTPYLAAFGVTPLATDISATASGNLRMTPAGATTQPTEEDLAKPVTAVAINLNLADIELTADSQYAASLKRVQIDVPTASPSEIHVGSVIMDGARSYTYRNPDGRVVFSGIALGAGPTNVVKESAPTKADAAPAPAVTPSDLSNVLLFELDLLQVRDARFQFDDYAQAGQPQVSFEIEKIELKDISTDPAKEYLPSTFLFAAHSPALAETIGVSGQINLATKVKTLDLNIRADGITGAAIDPYLKPLGISRAMQNATFTADMGAKADLSQPGAITTGFQLSNVRLFDDNAEWFAFSKVNLNDVRFASDGTRIALGNVAINGPAMAIDRSSEGAITTLGFTFDPSQIAPANPAKVSVHAPNPQSQDRVATETSEPLKLPVLEIVKLTWNDLSLTVNDAAIKPATSYKLVDVDVLVENLLLDQKATDAKPGTVSVSLNSPGNLESFKIDGKVAPTGESLGFDVKGNAAGVTLAGLRPLLNTFGIDPIFKQGDFVFAATGDARKTEKAFEANLALKDISLTDAATAWINLGLLEVKKASFDGQVAAVDSVTVSKPVLRVERDSQGRLSAAGVMLITPPNAPPPAPIDPTAPPMPSRVQIALPIVAKLNSLKLDAAQIEFVDHTVQPAATLKPQVDFSLQNAVVGEDAQPASFDATVSLPGAIGELKAAGSLLVAPTRQSISVVATGTGLGGSALAPYLPPGITTSTDKGSFKATFSAELSHNPQGGSAIRIAASDVRLDDGLQADPVVKLDAFTLDIPQFNLDGDDKAITIRELTTRGLTARVFEDDRGLVVPMLVIGEAAVEHKDAAPPNAEPPAPDKQALVGEAVDIEKLRAAARVTAPLVTIEKLGIGAERLSIQTPDLAYPLAVTNLSLTGQDIQMLGANPERPRPFDLVVTGGIEKLVDSLNVIATLRPFAKEPLAKMNIDVTGIHGTELTTLIPSLADKLDVSRLSDGRLTAEIDAQLSFTRRSIFGIDMDRDIGASMITLKNVALTQQGEARPLGAVDEVRIEQLRLTQNPTNVLVKSIDIAKPAAHIWRDDAGIHALGLTLKLPAENVPATQPVRQSPPAAPEHPSIVKEVAREIEQELEADVQDVTINSLTVSGIDLLIEDRVGQPATLLPIDELDVEVKGLTTRALREKLPVRFSVLAGAGEVPVMLADGGFSEPREVFAQFTANGLIYAHPKPEGWFKMSLSAFDLRAAKGIAQQMGIDLGNGTLDFSADARMAGADTFDLKLNPTLNSLRVSDSADGKIAKFLQIGVPLDLALVAVSDADDAISLPVTAPINAGKIDVGSIVGSAVGAVGAQIMKAVAAAPMKGGAGLAGMIGIDLTKEKDLSPITVGFQAGESLLTGDQESQIKQMIERLKQDPTLQITLNHTLGTADAELSNQRANPSQDDARAIAERLRQRKFDLQRQQVELSSTLRVALASQNKVLADESLASLKSVSANLAYTEESLDDMLGILRRGSARYADRRAKTASLELAKWRLEAIQDRFLSSDVKDIADRIAVARPTASLENAPEQGLVEIKFARRAKQ